MTWMRHFRAIPRRLFNSSLPVSPPPRLELDMSQTLPQQTKTPRTQLHELLEPFMSINQYPRPLPEAVKTQCLKLQAIQQHDMKWTESDYYCDSLVKAGSLKMDCCTALVEKMLSERIRPSMRLWQVWTQSIALTEGVQEALLFMREQMEQRCLVKPSMDILAGLSFYAILENKLDLHTEIFNILRRDWWPLDREAITHFIAALMDLIIKEREKQPKYTPKPDPPTPPFDLEHFRKLKQDARDGCLSRRGEKKLVGMYMKQRGFNKRNRVILKRNRACVGNAMYSLEDVLRYMRRSGMRIDIHQYHILIMGFSQTGLMEHALNYYSRYLKDGINPTKRLLDMLLLGISRYESSRTLKTDKFGEKTEPKRIIRYILSQYVSFGYKPSVEAFASIMRFETKYYGEDLESYYDRAQREYGTTPDFKLIRMAYTCMRSDTMKPQISRKVAWRLNKWTIWRKLVTYKDPRGEYFLLWGLDDKY